MEVGEISSCRELYTTPALTEGDREDADPGQGGYHQELHDGQSGSVHHIEGKQ